ncbi:MAG: hypothetical protein Q9213_001657 [Squamulea squamosa]
MNLPPFAPFPPANLKKEIVPAEWELCLDAWILLAQGHLLLSPDAFSLKTSEDPSVVTFLSSFVEANVRHPSTRDLDSKSKTLKHLCYLLVHRCLSELKQKPPSLLTWEFLSDFSLVYTRSPSLGPLLQSVWYSEDFDKKFQKHRSSLARSLEDAATKNKSPEVEPILDRTAALLRSCAGYGQFLVLGSDFIDALSALYEKSAAQTRRKLVIIIYRCFLALMDPSNPKCSVLLDHLYGLKSSKKSNSLLSALCSSTPFVPKLRRTITGPEGARGEKLIQELSLFEGTPTLSSKRRKPAQSKVNKGKGIQRDEFGHGSLDGGVHVHRMSLVTQMQELFPDLGSGFVTRLLDEYNDDTEQVTAHLLDDSLPPHLKSIDHSEAMYALENSHSTHTPNGSLTDRRPQPLFKSSTDVASHLAPHGTPPLIPRRRNIHDNDAFDRLTVSPSQIHRGRQSSNQTADNIIQDRSSAPNKAAILSALAAFDSDDDERDDTYDVEDVGGTVDTAIPGSDEVDADLRDKYEEALFRAYKMSPKAFERDAATRRGKARLSLRSETGMTDEAIEGWALMLGRDPRRLRRLEAKFEVFGGPQRQLDKTSYREGSGTEESDRGEGSSGRGRGGYRGRGRGGREGVAGNVAGPADEKGTHIARQRKDADKSDRANHNRRNQRAKKMARAGFPG